MIRKLQTTAALCFLAALPLFGNRPGTAQAVIFLFAAAFALAILSGPILRVIFRSSLKDKNPLIFLLWLNLLTAAASLLPLPLIEFTGHVRSQLPSFADLTALRNLLVQLIEAREDSVLYPILAFLHTLFATFLAIAVYELCREQRAFRRQCGFAILASLAVCIVAGIADYYSLIDLRPMRGLDPVVNPNDTQIRLQSFFGHSGWFAEFVTLTIPFAMLLLLLPWSYMRRISLVITLLVAGEFVLILTFQRGGWLSYPLTLGAVWAAIYVTRRIELGEKNYAAALKRSALKIALSVPLTILLSLALITILARSGLVEAGRMLDIGSYAERLRAIANASDRTEFMRAGFEIGKLHPILGAGNESFAYQYKKEFLKPEGRLFGTIVLPLHGSAHNVYFQTFAGKGALGLAVLIVLAGYMVIAGVRLVLRESALDYEDKLLLLVAACCAAAFLIYGNVQEIFYVQPLQYLFLSVAGLAAASMEGRVSVSSRTRNVVLAGCICLVVGHLIWEYRRNIDPHDRNFGIDYGCFDAETDGARQFSWCGVRARETFSVDGGNTIRLEVQSAGPGHGGILSIFSGPDLVQQNEIGADRETLQITIPSELGGRIWTEGGARKIKLRLALGDYLIPAHDNPNSADRRVLAFRLYKGEDTAP